MLTGYAKQSGLKYPLRKLKGKRLGQIKIIVGSLHMSAFVHFSQLMSVYVVTICKFKDSNMVRKSETGFDLVKEAVRFC